MNKPKKILITSALILVLVVTVAVSAFSLLDLEATFMTAVTTTDAIAVNGTVDESVLLDESSEEAVTSEDVETSEVPDTTEEPPVTEAPYATVTVASVEMYNGNLVVVDRENPYSYRAATSYTPSELDKLSPSELSDLGFVSLYGNGSRLYLLRSRLIFLKTEAYQGFVRMMSDYLVYLWCNRY